MASYKKLGKNILSLTVGNFASKLLSFFLVPFYTAVLTTEEYGTADLVTTTVTLLFPFFSFIICESMMRFAQEKNEDKEQVFSIGMLVWGTGFIVLMVLSSLLLFVPSLKHYWIFVVLYYFTYSLNSTVGYFVRGIEKVTVYSISGIVNTLFTVTLNLLFLLYFKIGVEGYLLSFIIANFIATVFMIVASKVYRYKIRFKCLDKELFRKMMKYSIPMIPNSASWWVSNSSDKYILTFFAGVAANGVYSVAYKIPSIITILTSIFATAWRLSAVEEFGTENSRKFFSNVFDMYITLTLCASSALMVINKPLASFLYSKDFYQAWQFVPVLVMAAVIHSYAEFFGTIYTSAMKTKMLFYSTLAGAISNIGLNFVLIPSSGGFGAAIATMLSYFVILIVRWIDSRKIMHLYYQKKSILVSAILIILQLIIACLNFKYEIIISAIIFVFILIVRRNNIHNVVDILLRKKHV